MEIIRAGDGLDCAGTAVALGNFDGLHAAHMKIIRGCVREAAENGLKSCVLLFDRNSRAAANAEHVRLIMTTEQKTELLKRENPDFVYILEFTDELMRLSPEEFAALLAEKLKAKIVCAGYNYRFGFRAAGDAETLKRLGEKYGFRAVVTDEVKIDGETVSSTRVRALIESGDVKKAASLLGRLFCVSGRVVEGLRNGRKMGLPTANVGYNGSMVLPLEGVYAGITEVDGKRYKSVVNIGRNPTFDAEKLTVESHILDFNGDIYGKQIRVYFVDRLRGDIKFKSADELKNQINRDKETARSMDMRFI